MSKLSPEDIAAIAKEIVRLQREAIERYPVFVPIPIYQPYRPYVSPPVYNPWIVTC